MRVSGSWRLSADGVPVPPPPSGAERQAEIARIRSSLSESSRNLPSRHCRRARATYRGTPPTSNAGNADQLVATNGVEPRGRHNSEGRRQWWGIPSRTLEAVLEHIEGDNSPRYEYPPSPAFSRRCGNFWTPRQMETTSSSSSVSRSRSSGSSALLVKSEPQETPLGWHMCSGDIVINEPGASSRLVKPKTESGLLPVKQEHLAMAADDEIAFKWARDDYVRKEKERQRRALDEIAARHRGREEGGVVILETTTRRCRGLPTPFATATQGRGAARTATEHRTTRTTTMMMTAVTTPISTSFSACRRWR
ncbi:Homeobox protein KNOX3 [Hordeum vulgare]|nr:Homeobox protein KNOX3 [Hordeum vulgare]